jgi:hypothetical protein
MWSRGAGTCALKTILLCVSRRAGAAVPVEVLLGAIDRQALGPVEGRCPETGIQDRQERLQEDFQSYLSISVSARNCLMWNRRVATTSCARVC